MGEAEVAIVTYAGAPGLDPDDRVLVPLFAERGARASSPVWDDDAVDWSRFDLVLIRSTWDYHHRAGAFLAWVDRVAAVTRVANPPAIVRWNSHKKYLRELEREGIPIVPTTWVDRGAALPDLADLLAREGAIVVKPAVSAGAQRTMVVRSADLDAGRSLLAAIVSGGDAMVQPYVRSLGTHGEHSLLFIAGELTHAVHRAPGLHGGLPPTLPPATPTVPRITPSARELEIAQRIVGRFADPPLYARVDLVSGDDGEPLLSEVELIEPSLFFRACPDAATRYAEAALRLARST